MPRGYLKRSPGVSAKVARGGSSRLYSCRCRSSSSRPLVLTKQEGTATHIREHAEQTLTNHKQTQKHDETNSTKREHTEKYNEILRYVQDEKEMFLLERTSTEGEQIRGALFLSRNSGKRTRNLAQNTCTPKVPRPPPTTRNDRSKGSSTTSVDKCFLCQKENIPLQKLMKGCKHDSACMTCLRRTFIDDAQQDASNYPLRCFHPSCCGAVVREAQIKMIAQNPKELQLHYRMSALAKARRSGVNTINCEKCNHPHRISSADQKRKSYRLLTCRYCKPKRKDLGSVSRKKLSGRIKAFISTMVQENLPIKHIKSFVDPLWSHMAFNRISALAHQQLEYAMSSKPWVMDVGFHYTRPENRDGILEEGLLSPGDRRAKGITSFFTGSVHGEGIYTANNALSHSSYGNLGLIVMRLKGRHGSECNIVSRGAPSEINVLFQSVQCEAVLEFPRSLAGTYYGKEALEQCHRYLQEILDQCFNRPLARMFTPIEQPEI